MRSKELPRQLLKEMPDKIKFVNRATGAIYAQNEKNTEDNERLSNRT